MRNLTLLITFFCIAHLLNGRQGQVDVAKVRASFEGEEEKISYRLARSLGIDERISYTAEMAVDSNDKTTWSAGSGKEGHNQWIRFDFGTTSELAKISIKNGYWINQSNWRANWRAKKIVLTTSEGGEYKLTLRDTRELQEFDLKDIKASWVKLTIKNSYPGTKSDFDVCISEVSFSGYGVENNPAIQGFLTAVREDDFKTVRKQYKALQKQFENPKSIRLQGLSLMDFSIRSGNVAFSKLLYKDGHKEFSVMGAKEGTDPVALTQQVQELRSKYRQTLQELNSTTYQPDRRKLTALNAEFEGEHGYLYAEELSALKRLIDKRTKEALSTEFKSLEEELLRIPLDFENHSKLVGFFSTVESRYQAFRSEPGYGELKKAHENRRLEFLERNLIVLKQKVNQAGVQDELSELQRTYTSGISRRPVVTELLAAMADKSEELKAQRAAILKRAEEERLRKAQQAKWEKEQAEARALARYGFEFTTDGLKNRKLIDDFFKGNFVDVSFNRDDPIFSSLLDGYMYAFARRCGAALPTDRVEIKEMVCETERVTKNGWGIETNRYCVAWKEVPTGLYVRRELYDAHVKIYNMMNRDQLKNVGKLLMEMVEGNSFQSMYNLAEKAKVLESDVKTLIRSNGCSNSALKRFEENLIRFANNQPPLKLGGDTADEQVDYSKKQDIDKLTKDLVLANSKSWTFKYISNSTTDVRVVSSDSQNRPAKITASYQFEGLFGREKDRVEITFKNGVPDCIYFRKYSGDCRIPDRKVVAALKSGQYASN